MSNTRNATLQDLAAVLTQQQARKVDLVATGNTVRSVRGQLVVRGTDPIITADGVTTADGTYAVTATCDEGISDRLDIPRAYLRRMREDYIELYDANVNGWLVKTNRTTMIRTFRADEQGGVGIARAFLSDRYARLDNLDALAATLDGLRQAGVELTAENMSCDLSDRRMVVRVTAPQIAALAPDLLRGYRSPYSGQTGDENPTVFAGFVLTNSETGNGAWTITPRLVVQVCNNGMTMPKDAVRSVHLGGKQDQGVIRTSADTMEKELAVVTARTRDAVSTFLDVDYMKAAIRRLTEAAGKEIKDVDDVKTLTKAAGLTEAQVTDVLGFFIRGGQTTVGGVAQAITAYAQADDVDADAAYDLEMAASKLLSA